MSWSTIRRALLAVIIAAYAGVLLAIWLIPGASLAEVRLMVDPRFQVSPGGYRALLTVAVSAFAALTLLGAWSWSTRTDRPFRIADGSERSVEAAAALVQRAVITRHDVRTVDVSVEHQRGALAVRFAIDVTSDALIGDVETRARDAAIALASRVEQPLAAAEVTITFAELNLVAARAHRAARAA